MTKQERALTAVNAIRRILTRRVPTGQKLSTHKWELDNPSTLLNDVKSIRGILKANHFGPWKGRRSK